MDDQVKEVIGVAFIFVAVVLIFWDIFTNDEI